VRLKEGELYLDNVYSFTEVEHAHRVYNGAPWYKRWFERSPELKLARRTRAIFPYFFARQQYFILKQATLALANSLSPPSDYRGNAGVGRPVQSEADRAVLKAQFPLLINRWHRFFTWLCRTSRVKGALAMQRDFNYTFSQQPEKDALKVPAWLDVFMIAVQSEVMPKIEMLSQHSLEPEFQLKLARHASRSLGRLLAF
jgi:hypothetical protein